MSLPGLTAAHRGYQYQDLIAAIALVDVVLGQLDRVVVDRKFFTEDIFDDLTLIEHGGGRARVQIKHSSGPPAPLSAQVFTSNTRGTRLDVIMRSLLADRKHFGEATPTRNRLVFTDQAPVDDLFDGLLTACGVEQESSMLPLGATVFRFEGEALWDAYTNSHQSSRIGAVLRKVSGLQRSDFEWLSTQLWVETGAPSYSGDLTQPGTAERMLLQRARGDIGSDIYPNEHRTAIDFASGLILAAQAARTGKLEADADSVVRRIQLRTDYGAVAALSPVASEIEVSRDHLVDELESRVDEAARSGATLVITGPPGQGKSWVSEQLAARLRGGGWYVASHYCYLGEGDHQRDDRVVLEAIQGSLLQRLAEIDHQLVSGHFPRYAADRAALESALRKAVSTAGARVALVIDGLDHIARVLNRGRGSDPSLVVCEALAQLHLPPGVALVVVSQPGAHLRPLGDAESQVAVPGMTPSEVRELAHNLREDESVVADDSMVDALCIRSNGNALYVTYLCRETARRDVSRFPAPVEAVMAM